MPLTEHIYSVLIVSASQNFNSAITKILPKKDFDTICFVSSIAKAKREVIERQYDFVIINAPLPDDYGRKFAIDVSAKNSTVAMMVVRNEVYSDIYLEVVGFGVFALSRPTSTQMISQAIDYMRATRERLRRVEKKTVSLEDKMSEIRIVNRAKWALIESCHMTEADAHRYIEKMAMDRSATKREVAMTVIETYNQPHDKK